MTNLPRVLLAGGGTAGHVNPLLALAKHLREQGYQLDILGTKEGKEATLLPAAGFDYTVIARIPLPRRPSAQLFTLPSRMRQTVKQVQDLIRRRQIEVVVGFGGYVSTPAYLAAKKCAVPIIIHEQNVRPGLANRLAARWAAGIGTTFSQTKLQAGKGQTIQIGLPLREEIACLVKTLSAQSSARSFREKAAGRFDLDPDKPTLLVTGGSLGAQSINEAFIQAIPKLDPKVQVLHLTGKGKDQPVKAAVAAARLSNYRVVDYLMQMEDAFGLADLVVSRAGAGMVAELAALGKPAIFVPLPIGNGEQKLNAQELVANSGAYLVENADFSAGYITEQVLPLLSDRPKLAKMAKQAQETGQTGAVEKLTKMINQVIS